MVGSHRTSLSAIPVSDEVLFKNNTVVNFRAGRWVLDEGLIYKSRKSYYSCRHSNDLLSYEYYR